VPDKTTRDETLPFIDEHRVLVGAPAAVVWRALTGRPFGGSGSGTLSAILGTEPARSSGEPFTEGSTVPGFKVSEAIPGERLTFTGRHRFSRYMLRFTLEAQAESTVLVASSYATFPGLHGKAYRLMVIGTGAHKVVVNRMLDQVREDAERA
jgi:hypothetical protein